MTSSITVQSDRAELQALCLAAGLTVITLQLRRSVWAAQVWAIDRHVWVEDQEDIDWLLVDLTSASMLDQYAAA